jgi:hypothetical protein
MNLCGWFYFAGSVGIALTLIAGFVEDAAAKPE